MPFKLTSADHTLTFRVARGSAAARGAGADLRHPDHRSDDLPTARRDPVRRRGVHVRDLGSSNGTFVNGERIETRVVSAGDRLTFGRWSSSSRRRPSPAPRSAPPWTRAPPPGATIVRQRPVNMHTPPISSPSIAGTPADKNREKLATLLEVSKGLGRAVDTDAILDKIVQYAYADPGCGPGGDPAARRPRRADPQDLARQARRPTRHAWCRSPSPARRWPTRWPSSPTMRARTRASAASR